MRTIKKILAFIVLTAPAFALAAFEPLVDCQKNCGWNELLAMVNKVIKFILFDMAVPIAAIMFAYAGVLMVTSGGSTESRNKAKGIFIDVLIGLVVAIAAWLIISTILQILGFNGSWIGF